MGYILFNSMPGGTIVQIKPRLPTCGLSFFFQTPAELRVRLRGHGDSGSLPRTSGSPSVPLATSAESGVSLCVCICVCVVISIHVFVIFRVLGNPSLCPLVCVFVPYIYLCFNLYSVSLWIRVGRCLCVFPYAAFTAPSGGAGAARRAVLSGEATGAAQPFCPDEVCVLWSRRGMAFCRKVVRDHSFFLPIVTLHEVNE